MKKITVLLMIMALGLTFAAQPAIAGSKQRYRWQGVASGVGASILGHALFNGYNEKSSNKQVTVYSPHCPSSHRYGYWEIQKVWVDPKYIKVWNPGHCDRRGIWYPGQWQMVEKEPGYWQEQKVWVAEK